MVKLKLGKKEVIIIISSMILLFFYSLFGITGIRFVIGFSLIFFFPTYLILSFFKIETEEKIILSIFLGMIIFPSITYGLGLLISLRLSILITFITLVLIGFLLKKSKAKFSSTL